MIHIDWYLYRFAEISEEERINVIDRCLDPLSKEIIECDELIKRASSQDEDHSQMVAAEETGIIEDLLGISFVICQSYITYVISSVIKLHSDCASKNICLKTTSGKKKDLLRFCARIIPATNVTEIEIIDACANYYKHHEEWPAGLWKMITSGHQRKILSILNKISIEQFSTSKFRKASSVLGNTTYENYAIFTNILLDWGKNVFMAYNKELKNLGLIH